MRGGLAGGHAWNTIHCVLYICAGGVRVATLLNVILTTSSPTLQVNIEVIAFPQTMSSVITLSKKLIDRVPDSKGRVTIGHASGSITTAIVSVRDCEVPATTSIEVADDRISVRGINCVGCCVLWACIGHLARNGGNSGRVEENVSSRINEGAETFSVG